jgi:hypothetical protein
MTSPHKRAELTLHAWHNISRAKHSQPTADSDPGEAAKPWSQGTASVTIHQYGLAATDMADAAAQGVAESVRIKLLLRRRFFSVRGSGFAG